MDFSKLSLSELAAGQQATVKIAKAGGKDQTETTGEKGEYVDPYTLGVAFPTQLGETKGKESKKGTGQIEVQIGQIRDDGTVRNAGRVWIDMPIIGANATMSAEEEAEYLAKAGTKFLRFLRAVAPSTFNVFESIDKTNPKKWVYRGFDGQPMNQKQREARAAEIDNAAVGVAHQVMAGTMSFAGNRVMLTKVANPNNAKYPYLNFAPLA